MKKYITTISLVLNIVLVTIFFFFYNSFKLLSEANNVNLNVPSESKTITNDATLSIIFGKIDSNFNLVITTMTILFTLFSFFLFKSVKDSFAHRLSILYKRQSDSEASWAKHKSDILDLRGDLSYEVADKMSKDLTIMFEKENKEYKDFVSIVEHALVCCDYYSQSLAFKKNVYPKFKVSVSSIIKDRLSITADLISTQTVFELETLGYERFLRLQDNIHKVCDLEDKQNLASIFSKLSFPTLD